MSDPNAPDNAEKGDPTAGEATSEPVVWRSSELFRGQKEVIILHGSEQYRLRQTRLGKLILHK